MICIHIHQIMLHENDEYLEESVFIEGIEVYVKLIEALGSATELDNVAQTVGVCISNFLSKGALHKSDMVD